MSDKPRKYVRVILAFDPDDEVPFRERLDEYIEDGLGEGEFTRGSLVEGAYVSATYETREEALYGVWKEAERTL